jgi:hypothetical protein
MYSYSYNAANARTLCVLFRPTCGRGRSKWVYAHWYEEGTWSGKSRGIEPNGTTLDVEGQTRFLVDDDLKITEMVVTRTFSLWEKKLQESLNQAGAG